MAKKRYMTVGQKERVRDRLLDHKFKPLREAAELAEREAAWAILRTQLTPAEWEQTERIPEGWLPLVSSVRVRDPASDYNNSYMEVKLSHALFVPSSLYQKVLGPHSLTDEQLDAGLWQDFVDANKQRLDAKADRQALYRTVEDAVEGWPEAASVINEVCGPGQPKNLPAVAALNEALDLPPGEGDKAA